MYVRALMYCFSVRVSSSLAQQYQCCDHSCIVSWPSCQRTARSLRRWK